jgi:Ser/Thr protein kinase RdoA (MazF antagonist)
MNDEREGVADVLARYRALACTTVSIADVPGGYVTRSWRIDNGAGSFLLRRLEGDARPDNAAGTAQVHIRAARAGLAPPLLANDTGGLVTSTGGRLYTVAAFLKGATAARDAPDAGLSHQLGRALGRLHQQLRGMPADGLPQWVLPGPAALGRALRAHDRPGCTHPAVRRVLRVKLAHAQAISPQVLGRLNGLDQQVIHGDVHPGNILVTGLHPVFVDFDLARSAPPAYELMRALIYCTHPAGPPEAYRDRVAAFLSGYLASRPLTEAEISTMVELYMTVQILDPYGFHACENARETLIAFGHARFALLYWLARHGAGLTVLAHRISHLTG